MYIVYVTVHNEPVSIFIWFTHVLLSRHQFWREFRWLVLTLLNAQFGSISFGEFETNQLELEFTLDLFLVCLYPTNGNVINTNTNTNTTILRISLLLLLSSSSSSNRRCCLRCRSCCRWDIINVKRYTARNYSIFFYFEKE